MLFTKVLGKPNTEPFPSFFPRQTIKNKGVCERQFSLMCNDTEPNNGH